MANSGVEFLIDKDGDLIFRQRINKELCYELWIWEDFLFDPDDYYLLSINEIVEGVNNRQPGDTDELPKWVVVA